MSVFFYFGGSYKLPSFFSVSYTTPGGVGGGSYNLHVPSWIDWGVNEL